MPAWESEKPVSNHHSRTGQLEMPLAVGRQPRSVRCPAPRHPPPRPKAESERFGQCSPRAQALAHPKHGPCGWTAALSLRLWFGLGFAPQERSAPRCPREISTPRTPRWRQQHTPARRPKHQARACRFLGRVRFATWPDYDGRHARPRPKPYP